MPSFVVGWGGPVVVRVVAVFEYGTQPSRLYGKTGVLAWRVLPCLMSHLFLLHIMDPTGDDTPSPPEIQP